MQQRQPKALTVQANGLTHRVWLWERYTRDNGTATSASPMLIVHGITNAGRGWDFVCHPLGDDRTVYAVDLRGHGETDKPEHGYRAADYAKDLAGIIEAMGAARPIVLGHSLGARAAARLAAERPDLVDRLILVDPPTARRTVEELRAGMEAFLAGVKATREGGMEAARRANPHWSEEQLAARVAAHQNVSDRVMLDPVEDFDSGTILDDLPQIICPTLFLYGDPGYPGPSRRPGIVSAEAMERARATLPRGEFVFVERAGHMVPWDNFAGFIEPLRRFLRTTQER